MHLYKRYSFACVHPLELVQLMQFVTATCACLDTVNLGFWCELRSHSCISTAPQFDPPLVDVWVWETGFQKTLIGLAVAHGNSIFPDFSLHLILQMRSLDHRELLFEVSHLRRLWYLLLDDSVVVFFRHHVLVLTWKLKLMHIVLNLQRHCFWSSLTTVTGFNCKNYSKVGNVRDKVWR